ncbi:type III secretion system cytoplasmic ring protein SctQ [Microbulbifer variabilis]|uniref:type III secretion system cytoplasmic ring protein SctQ n=1 Tax=Microbulbifer variabilis TaxID=266805 RepID=UPI001CFE9A4D|nr:type III secretion system cytoplasmic ring protein SctQ [Microbulbifer variabilis]
MSIDELPLPQFTRQVIDAQNIIVSSEIGFRLGTHGNTNRPNLNVLSNCFTSNLPNRALILEICPQNLSTYWKLYIGLGDAGLLLSSYLHMGQISELPIELVSAACELWFEQIISEREELKSWQITSVKIADVDPCNINYDYTYLFEVNIEGKSIYAFCIANIDSLASLFEIYGQKRKRHLLINLPTTFLVGQAHLDIEELRSLRSGDIVLVDNSSFFKEECLLLVNRQAIWSAQLNETNVKLIDPWNVLMENELKDSVKPVGNADNAESPEDYVKQLNNVSLTLKFELPGKEMTIEEIQSLTEGYTFSLDDSASSEILISLNHSPLGKGKLVNIEGRLGVQIIRWGRNGD